MVSPAGFGRSTLSNCLMVFLVLLLLQIWVCSDCRCRAAALRTSIRLVRESQSLLFVVNEKKKKKEEEELLHKYFDNGRLSDQNKNDDHEVSFEESKRRVPSCPDPLHN